MDWRLVSEEEFRSRIYQFLQDEEFADVRSVTGPGRSGAIAAVYASHILGVPFIPYGGNPVPGSGRFLIIDTATESGKTLNKAHRLYLRYTPLVRAIYKEPPRVYFWYEDCTFRDGPEYIRPS